MVGITDTKRFYSSVTHDYEDARNRLSNIDKLESDILHYVELGNYNAAQGSQLIKKLKEVRQIRRGYKKDFEEITLVYERLNKANIPSLKYSPAKCVVRPDQLNSILNAKL